TARECAGPTAVPGRLPVERDVRTIASPPRASSMSRSLRLSLAVALGVVSGLGVPARADDDPLMVGVLLPLTGKNATFGEESLNGILIAEKEIREKDKSFSFKLVQADEQSKAD